MNIKVPTAALLLVLFVFLKLIGAILWDWVWVLAPFWACVAFYAAWQLCFTLMVWMEHPLMKEFRERNTPEKKKAE